MLLVDGVDMTAREFIQGNEGRKNKPYKCSEGVSTIGVGHNIQARGLPKDIADYLKANGHILDEHIDRLFAIDLISAVSDCHKLFPAFRTLSHNQRIALTDFLFQLGYDRASKFVHFIAAVNTGRWDDAAAELRDSRYYRQVPKRAERVIGLLNG